MAKVAQTPGPWVLAGGAGIFSADCVKALAKAGFKPEDFGSYKHVKGKLREARCRVRKIPLPGQTKPPGPASEHDELLAQSTNGHLQQNALFQKTGGRGNACKNEPGAECYDMQLAPCAPLPGGSERQNVGTSYWAGGAGERDFAQNKTPGAPVSASQSRAVAKNTIRLVAKGPTQKDVQGRGKDARRRRSEERAARAASAGDLSPKNAGKGKAGDGKEALVDETTAQKCIEAWMEKATEAMRRQVMDEYSKDKYADTVKDLKKDKANAEARLEQSYKDINKARKDGDKKAERAAVNQMQWARQDVKEADLALKSAPCLKAQAASLKAKMAANGGVMPPLTGAVPGEGRDGFGQNKGGGRRSD
jgi:hypothetical protein